MVSCVAPHKPTFAGSPSFFAETTRQGPMAQFLQHIPAAPIGQGRMSAARSKTVSIPFSAAIFSICRLASQQVRLSIDFFSDMIFSLNSL
jgi:hypothetical protein